MENETVKTEVAETESHSAGDTFALAFATGGVGYLPLAPGTWGSLLGLVIYLAAYLADYNLGIYLLHKGWQGPKIEAWLYSVNLILLVGLCLAAIAVSGRAARVFGEKDPQKIVIDEVAGQLVVFLFIPFTTSWWMIAAGFVLFRLFDILKPYPIKRIQELPSGLGICADDVVAGIYAGVVLNLIHTISVSLS